MAHEKRTPSTEGIILRPMTAADGPALIALYQASPDTGRIQIAPCYHLDPYTAFTATRPSAVGVVAEAPGFEGLAGAGFVHFDRCTFEGELRDYAALSGVVVHPDHRRQGIATRLAEWRVAWSSSRRPRRPTTRPGPAAPSCSRDE